MYQCDRRFHVDTILPLYQTYAARILVIVCGEESAVWQVTPVASRLLKHWETDLPNHHKRGGQSQNRLMRIREQTHDAYVKSIATWVNSNVDEKTHLIIAGCSTKPQEVQKLLSERFTIDDTWIIEKADEVVKRAQTYLGESKAYESERDDWVKFMQEWNLLVRGKPNRCVYGREAVLQAIETGMLQQGWIHDTETTDTKEYLVHDPNHPMLRLVGGWAGLTYYPDAA